MSLKYQNHASQKPIFIYTLRVSKAHIHLHIEGYNFYEGLQVRKNLFQYENHDAS
jgi:hypothetical protein